MQTSDRLSWSQKIFFGFGHVFNDMCASLWFNYLLVYYHTVLSFSNVTAGSLLLVGQVADALTTPVIGMESDRFAVWAKYGKRKSWHLAGSLFVFFSFAFIFNPCLACQADTREWAKFIYFAPIIVIFQMGWASTQISHLSLIPTLSHSEHERVALTSIRYAFTVGSNFVVFGSVSALLMFVDVKGHDKDKHDVMPSPTPNGSFVPVQNDRLSPADIPIFRYLALITICVGALFSIGFHLGTKEPVEEEEFGSTVDESPEGHETLDDESRSEINSSTPLLTSSSVKMRAKDWFIEPHFYLVAIIYVCVRLITNVSQVYMSLFINDTLFLNKENLALIPLTIYAASMLTSIGQNKFNKIFGRTVTLGCGMLVCICYSVTIYFTERGDSLVKIYAAAVILGLGTSILMIGSLSLTADVIGCQSQTSAFVYGVMSFGDKLSNGIAVEIIQLIHPDSCACIDNENIYRIVEVYVIGGISIFGLLMVLILATRKIDSLRFYRRTSTLATVNNYTTPENS